MLIDLEPRGESVNLGDVAIVGTQALLEGGRRVLAESFIVFLLQLLQIWGVLKG